MLHAIAALLLVLNTFLFISSDNRVVINLAASALVLDALAGLAWAFVTLLSAP
jgi:hypothetical protein